MADLGKSRRAMVGMQTPPLSMGRSTRSKTLVGEGLGLRGGRSSVSPSKAGRSKQRSIAGIGPLSLPAVGKMAAAKEKERRSSIDCGPKDWPSVQDMGTTAPPIKQEPNYPELVEEIRGMEICIAEQVLPEDPDAEVTAQGPQAPNAKVKKQFRFHTQKVRIPNAKELGELPPELAEHLSEAGRQTLARLFVPVLLLRHKKTVRQKLLTERQQHATSVPVEFLGKMSLFRPWPSEFLPRVIAAMKLVCLDPREFIVYEKQPASAMLFLTNGAVHLLSRHTPKTSYLGSYVANSQLVGNMHCFGEMNLLTDEPWPYAIRALNRVDMWILTKEDFHKLLKQVPSHIMGYIIRTAFHRRNAAMRKNFPFTMDMLRAQPLFRGVSNEFATELIDRLEPHAVPKDFLLCTEGDTTAPVYFVMHGTVGQFRKVGEEMVQVGVTGPGGVIGDTAMVHGASSDGTFRTLIDADLYQLPRNTFNSIARTYPADIDMILEAARTQRHAEISTNQSKYADVVHRIPMLSHVLPSYYVKDFLPLLQPKSYRPLSSVCSTASFCDRLIILVKGKIRLHDGYEMKANECIGWTCCIPHRWGQGAITGNTTAEVLEVMCPDYMDFLQSKHLLNTVIKKTTMLMFPKAFPKPDVENLHAEIGPHPVAYPVSKSRVVNHNEQMFCTVHMHLLDEHQREEQEKKEQKVAETPPAYRQLSSGVYIPTHLQVRGFK